MSVYEKDKSNEILKISGSDITKSQESFNGQICSYSNCKYTSL